MGVTAEKKEPEDFSLLFADYQRIRRDSELLCEPLAIEDYGIQTMPDISPPKWHLAHTSWFFENFILKPYLQNYKEFHPQFSYLFNSYYEQAGTFHPRPRRGLLSRPTVKEVKAYRQHVDDAMQSLLEQAQHPGLSAIHARTETGLQHEQQHQELLLTDIKHIFGSNPLKPVYQEATMPGGTALPLEWIKFSGGLKEIGADDQTFAYDNEKPRHNIWMQPYCIASRLITNKEYLEFINDGGYRRPELWLSEGWKAIKDGVFKLPLYWQKQDEQWFHYTLSGMKPLDMHAPVSHVNYFEADAFASWANARLATEFEWEVASETVAINGNLRDQGYLQPVSLGKETRHLHQFYGDVWEWTQSAYGPYHGYTKAEGALGEYNGKFMCGQYVLRGGSCVTPLDHIRKTYRNFFYPADQWQFSGIRLARNV